MSTTGLTLALTPRGHLLLARDDGAASAPEAASATEELTQQITQAFTRGSGHGLLQLGARNVGQALPPVLAWWRDLGARYVTAVCHATPAAAQAAVPDAADHTLPLAPALPAHQTHQAHPPLAPVPAAAEFAALIADAPPMSGAEYLTAAIVGSLWSELDAALRTELAESGQAAQDFLRACHPAWNLVGRVHFNLAENRKDEEAPFAFLATYTTALSAQARAQHLPLGQALKQYAGAKHRAQLLSLLEPVQRASEQCPWLRALADEGALFHPLRWNAGEALQLLTDLPRLEAAGIVVRMPALWKSGRPPRPQVKASVGDSAPSLLGQNALLDFSMEMTLDGETLSPAEIKKLLAGSDGLQLLRGQWIEVDRSKLQRMLDRFRAIEQSAGANGVPFAQAMRLLAGAGLDGAADAADGTRGAHGTQGADEPGEPSWASVQAGPWLAGMLRGLRSPEGLAQVHPGAGLKAELRPYQAAGVRWLYLLHRLGLGACLADDMGLGKTIQVLSLLLTLKQESAAAQAGKRAATGAAGITAGTTAGTTAVTTTVTTADSASARRTSLLVVPASLLANWAGEIERFTPGLTALIAHPSAMPSADLKSLTATQLGAVDLVITTYGTLLRIKVLMDTPWRIAVLDEAQAIKNPGTKQTRAVKQLNATMRIALTGTPVENRLSDLWSIFDFINPGLLGSGKAFTDFTRRLADSGHYGPLRELVRPYILRRLKTDKTVIADLPDKTEMKAFCQLSAKQAALYQRSVQELAKLLEEAKQQPAMARRGLVLSFLMRFKQICNHPSQWLGDAAWREADSGKFARLRAIAEVVAAKQEKMLVFTQFRETTAPLAAFLGGVFGRSGVVLDGSTPIAKRKELVKRFQEDEATPFFVLSLKAGGAGLNLTAAAHVVHFDRWWNPAVENQATDRAFRIGQTNNVLVHKFICQGTVEDKIDKLIESKQRLTRDVIEGGAEVLLTEMQDDELLRLVALDIHTATVED